MPREDTEAITYLLSHLQPKTIFEFGTNWGFSTAMFVLNSPPAGKIWTLDICQELFPPEEISKDPELGMVLSRSQVGWAYKELPSSDGKVTQVFQDSLKLEWDDEIFPKEFDLILVDACHKFEFVKSDTEKAVARLASEGILLWHDYYTDVGAWTDVFEYVNQFARSHPGVCHLKGTHVAAWVKR
jgi:hypothetical protein